MSIFDKVVYMFLEWCKSLEQDRIRSERYKELSEIINNIPFEHE